MICKTLAGEKPRRFYGSRKKETISVRLDQFISKSLGISRKNSKKLILSKRVKVNGKVVKDPAIKVENEIVEVNDIPIKKPEEKIYIMLNKPAGFVTSTRDVQPTVLDLIDHPRVRELHPVGRLDKDATGLLILTNDGEFTHRVTSPKHHVQKEYEVVVEGEPQNALKLLEGVKVGGYFFKAICVKISENVVHIVIDEGKYHQVKLMMDAVGLSVKSLKRIRIGGLRLDVEEGHWRELSKEEVKKVMEG